MYLYIMKYAYAWLSMHMHEVCLCIYTLIYTYLLVNVSNTPGKIREALAITGGKEWGREAFHCVPYCTLNAFLI